MPSSPLLQALEVGLWLLKALLTQPLNTPRCEAAAQGLVEHLQMG